MSSESLHIPREKLSQEARLLHYAITSLKEELDAVDWYRQRADDSEDEALRQILLHNMREEMEHASMLLEWIRRRNPDFAGHLKTYLFTDAPILTIEKAAEDDGDGGGRERRGGAGRGRREDLGETIGSLKGHSGSSREHR
ncbi:MAG: ferritin [Alphaproteobacteria bacterium]|nr:ferritin [Alphaproteobacteria bacterium]